ncbi:ABC transporter substrate-binding protein [Microbacterium sp. No. 7]|uniref:ABC transporter substrate-binding protein n=1 Tax=Microbacterium sp. No. 7 TaxID=1714373 RepID=UPI0006D0A694|nr:ABC transporter substrate-binding protein [Microbacterium sp. No. 7]ALJ21589.1 hypothetical protein AOA12_17490 [Microbacterium sp. No. 7]
MRTRSLRLSAALALPLLLLAGCSTAAPEATTSETSAPSSSAPASGTSATRTVTDQYGTRIEIPADVQRVAPTIGAFGHITAVVGAADKIVATIPSLGEGLFHEVWPQANPDGHDTANVEEIIASGAQVVYGPNVTEEVTAQLEAAGIVVITIDRFGTPDEMMTAIELIGDIVGDNGPARASAFTDFYAETIADVEDRVAGAEPVKVLNLRVGGDGYRTVGGNDISSAYAASAGGDVVSADVDSPDGTVGAEQILAWAPEVIFTMGRAAREQIVADPALASVPAVQNGAVFTEPSGTYPWSVRSAEGVLMPVFLGTILHPEAFADLSLAEVTQAFYERFYGYELSDEQTAAVLAGSE